MSVNIRYPNITGLSEKEQLVQIKSYLHQLVEQLNYALPTLGTGGGTASGTYEAQGGEISYYELQSMIIASTNKLRNEYEKLYSRLENDYVGKVEFQDIVDDLEALVKALPDTYLAKGDFNTFKKILDADILDLQEGLSTAMDDIAALEEAIANIGGGGADFVSEIGTEAGWTYKKWNSGSYDMFGAFTVTTTTICTDMGSMFCSEELSIPTPFAIESAIVSGSADDLFLVTSGGRASVDAENHISFVLLRPFSFDAEMEIHVRLHVTGTCNLGGTE